MRDSIPIALVASERRWPYMLSSLEGQLNPRFHFLNHNRMTGPEHYQAVLLSQHKGPQLNLQRLRAVLAENPSKPIVVLKEDCTASQASRYIREGAAFCLNKLKDLEEILPALFTQKTQGPDLSPLDAIVGASPEILRLKEQILSLADYELPVLITGESGTGKELVARSLHLLSRRKNQTFLPVNCGAIPETLMEAEFFGCEKGSFTGALSRKGFFEQASRGSLFLDEIAELPSISQVKLLRALESGKITRIGEGKERSVSTRLITATNRNMPLEVRQGRIRMDFYFRINVLKLNLPPLRQRISDLQLLAERIFSKNNFPLPYISQNAMDKLQHHHWPGNVRELTNVLERAYAFSNKEIISQRDIQFDLE
jgi:two-component system response regulator PilR (NtrC family)